MYWVIAGVLTILLIVFFQKTRKSKKAIVAQTRFPNSWRTILQNNVVYYNGLNQDQKKQFEDDILTFLNDVEIEGVKTTVNITDKLLVASSAVIPVFGFPNWDYRFLKYVILYPGSFNRNFELNDEKELVTGMVGTGIMEGRLILSKASLHQGFKNTRDKKNVGIHEFIHLLDKQDGSIDGTPTFLNENEYVLPWLELIRHKTNQILEGKTSDINPYGATGQEEFLSVTGEYFFERPHLLKQKHPELFDLLCKAFNQDPTEIISRRNLTRAKLGRNSPCPCNSGKKFKHCCLTN